MNDQKSAWHTPLRVTAALTIILGVTAAAPAAASATDQDAVDLVCWSDVDLDLDLCFGSEAEFEAELEARGVELIEPSGADDRQPGPQSRGAEPEAALLTSYVYARLYENESFGGSTYTISGSDSTPCTGATISRVLTSTGFNDRTSSYVGYLSCRVRIYEHSDFTGATHGYFSSASSVGSMNDKASAVRLID